MFDGDNPVSVALKVPQELGGIGCLMEIILYPLRLRFLKN